MIHKQLQQNKETIGLGISLAILVLFHNWLDIMFIFDLFSSKTYSTIIAVLFTILGIWFSQKISKPKINTLVIEKEIFITNQPFVLNKRELSKLNISKRELQVLELISKGMSNQEIAANLFVSVNTIKTHASNLFEKLEVNRRTQAIEKAKKLLLIQ